jgi:hypothetical protein
MGYGSQGETEDYIFLFWLNNSIIIPSLTPPKMQII